MFQLYFFLLFLISVPLNLLPFLESCYAFVINNMLEELCVVFETPAPEHT